MLRGFQGAAGVFGLSPCRPGSLNLFHAQTAPKHKPVPPTAQGGDTGGVGWGEAARRSFYEFKSRKIMKLAILHPQVLE